MDSPRNRRRFLQLTGTASAASLAGCSDLSLGSDDGTDDDDPEGDGTDDGSEDDGDAGAADATTSVTTIVELGMEEQQQLMMQQGQLEEQIEEGEIDEEEAMEELEALGEELLEEPIEELEDAVEDNDDLTIEDSLTAQGGAAYRIGGSPDALIEALNDGTVDMLLSGEEYDAIQEQQDQELEPEE